MAITRNACPSIINSLIRGDSGMQSLEMHDRQNDNPIISYIKTANELDFDEGGIGHMLIKDEKGERMQSATVLSGGKRVTRGRFAAY